MLGLFTCITAPIGLVLAIVALVQIGRDPNQRGSGLAVGGLITSLLAVLMIPVLAAILFPVFARARQQAQASSCMNNVKQISMAMMQYRSDWDDTYPPAGNWKSAVETFVKNSTVWNCPADKSGKPGYAMNGKLAGMPEAVTRDPRNTVMIFESMPGANQFGGPELLPKEPRHMGEYMIAFSDGHVARVPQPSAPSLIWDPMLPGTGMQ